MFLRKLPVWAWFLLCSEMGEVASEEGNEAVVDDGPQLPVEDTEGKGEEDKGGKDDEGTESDELAIPSELAEGQKLSPELEKHRAGMHRGYTKGLEKLRAAQEANKVETEEYRLKGGVVDKFFNDKDYALKTVQDWAKKAGYSLTRAQAAEQVAQATGDSTQGPSSEDIEAMRVSLPEELQSFAPALAKANFDANRRNWAPILAQAKVDKEKQQEVKASERDVAISTQLEALAKEAPGFEEHQEAMIEVLDYIQSGNLTHKKWGDLSPLLLKIVKGSEDATNAAAERMRQAARHSRSTPQGSAGPKSSAEKVTGAASDEEAWAAVKETTDSLHPDVI